MPLKYYPLTRIITNLYTRGSEFVTAKGERYVGRYYRTYDGRTFAGINPVLGTNEELFESVLDAEQLHDSGRTVNLSTQTYSIIQIEQQATTANNAKLTELTSYYPDPLESDYARGYFTRYFAKTVSGPQYVFEISKLDWTKIQNGDVEDTVLGYETIDMLWQLTGPLNDKRVSQYQIQGGVYDTNKRVTENKAKVFSGLLSFIGGDYTKFARITP